MRLPSTFPPKSLTAICAAATEPGPLRSEYRPVISVSTPILTTSSDTCAPANDVVTKSAATLEIARMKYLGFMNFLPFDEPEGLPNGKSSEASALVRPQSPKLVKELHFESLVILQETMCDQPEKIKLKLF